MSAHFACIRSDERLKDEVSDIMRLTKMEKAKVLQDEALFGIECSELSAARNVMKTSVIPTPMTPPSEGEN